MARCVARGHGRGSIRGRSTARAGVLRAWEIGDHVQLSGEGERYSAETPLRATFYGISADGGAVHVSYTWDSATVAPRPAALWFTDGNDRIEASTLLVARLVERPRLTIDVRPELWWGVEHAPRRAVLQSPSRARSADCRRRARHLLWRRYERSLHQELRLSAGAFAQQAYPTRWTASPGYEQSLRLTT